MDFSKHNHKVSQNLGKQHSAVQRMARKTKMLTLALMLAGFMGFSQQTYVPDDNFEQALIDLGYDTVLDDYVTTANISGVTGLNIDNLNIADLTGIEDFTALTYLYCYNNQLTSLNVSQNINLNLLFCSGNQLGSLDMSQNTALTQLNIGNNQLTSLDVAQNTDLTLLDCNSNFLTNLDVTQNTALTSFNCYNNQLTSLDVTQNTALTYLACSQNEITSLDVTQNTALTELTCSENDLTVIDVTQIIGLVTLNIFDNHLTSLDVAQNAVLDDLDCSFNELTSLDVTQNTALTLFSCRSNQITSLDVTQNTALIELACAYNQLPSLDISLSAAMINFSCNNNQLTALNVKNGNNSNFTYFRADNNPDLNCIEVDNAVYSSTNWTLIDAQSAFSEDCGTLSIPNPEVTDTISIYPNPVQESFTISTQQKGSYILATIKGQQIKNGLVSNGTTRIGVSNLASGLYFINIKTQLGNITKKIIKL